MATITERGAVNALVERAFTKLELQREDSPLADCGVLLEMAQDVAYALFSTLRACSSDSSQGNFPAWCEDILLNTSAGALWLFPLTYAHGVDVRDALNTGLCTRGIERFLEGVGGLPETGLMGLNELLRRASAGADAVGGVRSGTVMRLLDVILFAEARHTLGLRYRERFPVLEGEK
jgi:hypothetical protein